MCAYCTTLIMGESGLLLRTGCFLKQGECDPSYIRLPHEPAAFVMSIRLSASSLVGCKTGRVWLVLGRVGEGGRVGAIRELLSWEGRLPGNVEQMKEKGVRGG